MNHPRLKTKLTRYVTKMADIDQDRRAMLTAKYGLDRPPMNPALNTTVQAILGTPNRSWAGRAGGVGSAHGVDRGPLPRECTRIGYAGLDRDLRAATAAGRHRLLTDCCR